MPKYQKDYFLNKTLSSKRLYVVLLVFVSVYLYEDHKVLNLPEYLFGIRLLISLLIIIVFLFWRFKKYREYYLKKIKDKIYILFLIFGVMIFSLILQGILNIPIDYFVISSSKNSTLEYYDCKIDNVITTGIDKIYFVFLDRKYYRYFEVSGYEREDLINNYLLRVRVKKSIEYCYSIESMELMKKSTVLPVEIKEP